MPKLPGRSGVKAYIELLGASWTPLDVHFASFYDALIQAGKSTLADDLLGWWLDHREE